MPHKKHLSDAELQRLVEKYLAGEPTKALAEEFGYVEPSVRSLLRNMGIPMRLQKFHTKLNADTVATVGRILRDGGNMSDARLAVSVSLEPFYDWIKKGRAGSGGLYKKLVDTIDDAFEGISPHSRPQRIYTLNERFFDDVDTEHKAYWLGFMTADGFVCGSTFGIGLKAADKPHLQKFLNDIGSNAPIHDIDAREGAWLVHPDGRRRLIQGGPQCRVDLGSKYLTDRLAEVGIVQNKSLTVNPWNGPRELLPAYWRGVFDGDGCIHQDEKEQTYSFTLIGNHSVIIGFSEFVCERTRHKGYIVPAGNVFRVSWSGNRLCGKICKIIYGDSTVYLDRKHAEAKNCMSLPKLRDWSIWTLKDFDELLKEYGTYEKMGKALGSHMDTVKHVHINLKRKQGI